MTCPRPHGQLVAQLELELGSSDIQFIVLSMVAITHSTHMIQYLQTTVLPNELGRVKLSGYKGSV